MRTEDPNIYFISNNNGITLYRSDSTEKYVVSMSIISIQEPTDLRSHLNSTRN